MEEVVQAIALKQQLDSLRPLDKEQEAKIMQKFRLDWNYHSNNLEGNSLTYGETKALIMYGITALGKPLKDHFEVTGHNEAINWVIDVVKGDYPLNQNFIRELHTLLLKESYEVDAITPDGKPTKKRIKVGDYKSSPNHVQTKTGETFYFATPEETPAEMAGLMGWYNEKGEDEAFNRILLAAEFHYKFISIHPFDDGNGRTARILMNFILMKFGYPPVIIKTEDKANYYAALRLADTGNLEAFVNYIATNLVRSLEIMIAGANGESIEDPDDIDKEIALLEKRLSGLGEKSNVGKSNEAIRDICHNAEQNILTKLKNHKFQNFYIDTILKFYLVEEVFLLDNMGQIFRVDDEFYEYDDLNECLSKISDRTLSIQFNILHSKFNRIGFGEFDFETTISFEFGKISYTLLVNENQYLQKPYGVYLNDREIDEIIINETKRHTAFIEQKIAEKESNG